MPSYQMIYLPLQHAAFKGVYISSVHLEYYAFIDSQVLSFVPSSMAIRSL